MPVIGFLATASPDDNAARLLAFRDGLGAAGYRDGQNVKLEYRWLDESSGRLPELATGFVNERVAVLVAGGGTASALAAKEATKSVPIVFGIGGDPVSLGLVASLSRPGGNVTGVTSINVDVAPKRLQLLHELLPSVTNMALLVDPTVAAYAEATARVSQEAANAEGLQLNVLRSSQDDFDAVFEAMTKLQIGALAIAPDNLFTAHSEQLAEFAVHQTLPAVYEFRRFVAAGGLMSYGSSETEYYRLVGTYAGES